MAEEATETVEKGVEGEGSPASEEQKGVEQGESPAPEEEKAEEKKEEGLKPDPQRHKDASQRIIDLNKRLKLKDQTLLDQEKRIQELEKSVTEKSVAAIKRPNRDDFEDENKYLDAVDDYHDKRTEARLAEIRAKETASAASAAATKAWDTFFDKAEALDTEQYPDLVEAIEAGNKSRSMTPAMEEVIRESDVGPQMLVHLHRNKDVAEKIKGMSVLSAVREMDKIASNIIKAQSGKTVTSAPNPGTPIKGESGVLEKDPDKMTAQEWNEWRNKNKKIL